MPDIIPIVLWCLLGALVVTALVVARRTRRLRKTAWRPVSLPEADAAAARRAAESLSQAVTYQTVSQPSGAERGGYGEWVRLREFLKNRYPLAHQTLMCEQVGFSLLYRWPSPDSRKEPILFCAHMDVVPAEGVWTHGPFSGDIADDCVWGRGTLDCKNVLICLLEAVEDLLQQGIQPGRDIFFAFGHDEEIGGLEGAGNIAALFAERNARFDMVLDEGGFLGRSAVPVGRPVAHIGVAEKGIANLRFTARGGGGHASQPPRRTGLGRLAEALCRLEFRPLPPRLTPLVKDALLALGAGLPIRWRVYLANLRLFRRSLLRLLAERPEANALIRTTVAPTMAKGSAAPNVLPDNAEITLNMRILHGENDAALTQYLTDLTADLDVEVEVLRSTEPSGVSRYNGRSFAALSEAVRQTFGPTPVIPALMYSGTDARNYEPFSECVYRFMPFILTPEEQGRIHGADERVSIEALGRAVAFYSNLMKNF